MRKVCLSKCFKRKMSRTAEAIWEAIIGIAIFFLLAIAVLSISGGTGFLLSFIFPEIELRDYIPTGMSFYVGIGVLWWILFLLWKTYKFFTSKAFKFVKEKYENNPETCSIFEYCDEQEENKKEK